MILEKNIHENLKKIVAEMSATQMRGKSCFVGLNVRLPVELLVSVEHVEPLRVDDRGVDAQLRPVTGSVRLRLVRLGKQFF
jgi:hypothetical protein